MYKGAQNKQDWINRTGSHATRFHMRQYETEAKEVFDYHIPHSDPYRMRLAEMKEERETLLNKVRICTSAQRKAKHQGLDDDAKRLSKMYYGMCNRIGILNSVIKSENVRLSTYRDIKAFQKAARELLPESKVQEILARSYELQKEIAVELGLHTEDENGGKAKP